MFEREVPGHVFPWGKNRGIWVQSCQTFCGFCHLSELGGLGVTSAGWLGTGVALSLETPGSAYTAAAAFHFHSSGCTCLIPACLHRAMSTEHAAGSDERAVPWGLMGLSALVVRVLQCESS